MHGPALLPSIRTPRPRADGESLSGRLRRDTRNEHERLEARLRLPGSVSDDADYRRLLTLWAGVWDAVATSVPPAHELITVAAAAAAALDADRSALGSYAPPPRVPFPLGADGASLWGVTYVLRGAALGNRVLHPLIRRELGVGYVPAFRYLAGSEPDIRPEWRTFRERLDRWGAGRSDSESRDVLAAAVDTFRFVGDVADAVSWPTAPNRPAGEENA